VRCMHEAKCHEESSFVTLTYDDGHLPSDGSLDRKAFRLFMDRLRKHVGYAKVRYFHCGEYGERSGRPHYHAILFGYWPSDARRLASGKDYPLWSSVELGELWPLGHAVVGQVTFESAAYVARYVVKKITGDAAKAHYQGREPEYATMSRRPGIGKLWLEQFGDDVYPADEVIARGHASRPPRFYDKLYEASSPLDSWLLKRARADRLRLEDQTEERLKVREAVASARLSHLPRGEM